MIGPRLTLDDLENLAFRFGGSVEPRAGGRFVLVGARIGGRLIPTLGPVDGVTK